MSDDPILAVLGQLVRSVTDFARSSPASAPSARLRTDLDELRGKDGSPA